MLNTHVDDLVDELIHGVHPRLQVVRLHIVVRILAELAGEAGTGFLSQAAAEMSLLANSNDGPAVIARVARQREISGA